MDINQSSSIQISSSIRFEPPFLPYQCASKSALLFNHDSHWSLSRFLNLTDYPVLPSLISVQDIEYTYGGVQDGYAIYNERSTYEIQG